ncbi:hypothetical protein N7516_002566 [Penicillium verrucosum]|uniref:uncharacterized protein n=1 Tax=Penicillium verrucosum TaxID=60171 RepID=UPI00254509C9|nr:uncharacterized protein N7516_002566 [Penicillium verrucosum]KAJ5942398.1 hypothetical protein N7516_002566 [Penicillium verrucosum]
MARSGSLRWRRWRRLLEVESEMDSSTAKELLRERTIGTGTASGGWKGGPGGMRMGGTGGQLVAGILDESKHLPGRCPNDILSHITMDVISPVFSSR